MAKKRKIKVRPEPPPIINTIYQEPVIEDFSWSDYDKYTKAEWEAYESDKHRDSDIYEVEN